MDSAELQDLISSLNQFTISRYILAASLMITVYDWLLLSGDESVTIWRTRWTLPKGIYYFNRVVTTLALALTTFQLTDLRTTPLSHKFCTVYTFVNGLTQVFSMFLSNLLLTIRLVALYRRKPWVSWFLYSFLVISYVTSAIMTVVTLREYGESIGYSLALHACGSKTRSALLPVIFAVPSAFEFTIFSLTGFRAWRDARNLNLSNAPFLTVLYRDGIVFFFLMVGVRIWNIWIYATQPLESAYEGIFLLWAVMTVLSTRVYLNLVFLARGPILEPTEVSRAQFTAPSNWGGIKMRVQTTTIGDAGEVVSFGEHGGRPPMPSTMFDTTFGIDSVVHADSSPVWNDRASKKEGPKSHPPSRRNSSHRHRPFSPLSFVQPTPRALIHDDKEV